MTDARVPPLLFLESVDANSVPGETALEHLRASEAIAKERGFAAESVTRGDDSRVVTPVGFTDDAFDLSFRSQIAVAARIWSTAAAGKSGNRVDFYREFGGRRRWCECVLEMWDHWARTQA
jgi:hypothetical protein